MNIDGKVYTDRPTQRTRPTIPLTSYSALARTQDTLKFKILDRLGGDSEIYNSILAYFVITGVSYGVGKLPAFARCGYFWGKKGICAGWNKLWKKKDYSWKCKCNSIIYIRTFHSLYSLFN